MVGNCVAIVSETISRYPLVRSPSNFNTKDKNTIKTGNMNKYPNPDRDTDFNTSFHVFAFSLRVDKQLVEEVSGFQFHHRVSCHRGLDCHVRNCFLCVDCVG